MLKYCNKNSTNRDEKEQKQKHSLMKLKLGSIHSIRIFKKKKINTTKTKSNQVF